MYVLNVMLSLLSSKTETQYIVIFYTMYDDGYAPRVYTAIFFYWAKFFELYVC